MRSKIWLWTTVSTLALTASASAADLAARVAAAPVVAPPPTWAGFYIGANVGAIHQLGQSSDINGTLEGAFLPAGVYNSDGGTGATAGGQIGYNWQYRAAVVGVEADAEYTGGSKGWGASAPALGSHPGGAAGVQGFTWLATFRARMGLAVENVLVYTTGGLAVGHVRDHFGGLQSGYGCSCDTEFSASSTRAGWVIGGGVETMWWNNWTVRVEGLYVDLGQQTVSSISNGGAFQATFSNSGVIGRIGLNYKW
jgi:outer membrane immunogenic protein